MPEKKLHTRHVNYLCLIPRLLLLYIFLFVPAILFDFIPGMILGLFLYVLTVFLLNSLLNPYHRKAINLYKNKKYQEAIDQFRKSYDYFCKHPRIDKYRWLTLLSASRMSYTEMALINIAFLYTQLENPNPELSKEYYEKTLKLFPNNQQAREVLKLISAYKVQNEPKPEEENEP